MHVVPVSLLLLFPECYPARSFLHTRGFASVGVFLRCFCCRCNANVALCRFSRRHGGTQSEMCFMPRLGSVCMCASKCLRSALDDGAFSNFSTHPGWLRLRVLLLPLPAVCCGHSEVGRGAGYGRLAGRQNLRGNKTTVCAATHAESVWTRHNSAPAGNKALSVCSEHSWTQLLEPKRQDRAVWTGPGLLLLLVQLLMNLTQHGGRKPSTHIIIPFLFFVFLEAVWQPV